jgi:dihydrofolate synthase / folylpolyglutamate synthase
MRNAATAIAALRALRKPIARAAYARGVADARLAGRLQRIDDQGVEIVIDVAHNPQATRELATSLQSVPARGRTLAVFAALGDKDIAGVIAAVADQVDAWFLAGLQEAGPRGLGIEAFAQRLEGSAAAGGARFADVGAALRAARAQAQAGDRILVFGSFHTAAAAMRALRSQSV